MRPENEQTPSPEGEARLTCPNCGAEFPAGDARCPYCGELNPTGAEAAYMRDLAEIRDETDDLDDDAQDVLKANLRRNATRTAVIIVAAAAVIAALFFAVTCADKNDEQRELREFQARESFRSQHFDQLDRLYDAGDDDALSNYAWSLMDDPGFDALFSWKHADYLEVHDDWQTLQALEDNVKAGSLGSDDYIWTLSLALRIAFPEQYSVSSSALSPDEEARAAGYRAYARQFLRESLNLSDAELAELAGDAAETQGSAGEDERNARLAARLREIGAIS